MSVKQEKILVALSGGVDSSIAAYLLQQEGHELKAVYVKTWETETDPLGECPGARDLADARGVAKVLNIPFEVVNLMDFYKEEVVKPMIDGYAKGITPNPDILCNRRMKFGELMDHAIEQGCDALATGHYCRRLVGKGGVAELWEGIDKNKDQSYFLSRITGKQLEYARFPLGDFKKEKVRDLAKKLDLKNADKKDSQGICFLGKVKVPDFLSNFITEKPGEIVTTDGKILGIHKGLHRYTLGQRRGIGVPSNTDHENYVVTGKDETKNRLIVAFESIHESTLWGSKFQIESVSFLNFENPKKETRFLGKPRYRDPSVPLCFKPLDRNRAEIVFDIPQRALTPGQVLAIYQGERLIGSGVYSLSKLGRAKISA